jgi:hypothetical protein
MWTFKFGIPHFRKSEAGPNSNSVRTPY